ncbi:hypothetical protein LCGC14_1473740 [marine sediment metagenome]|uniref:ParB-like N-terminal domain-containing protein n=1 Tax=marine sediment metagenome TaxID=412755 RepID=A0A0F9MDD0_9ZZZZ
MDKIEISKLVADPEQPRQEFEPMAMKRLEESVKKQGILVPLTVEKQKDGTFLIIDGERRFRTAKKLGLKVVPIIVHEAMDNFERMVTRFHLQEQHTNWSSFDKARAINSIKSLTDMTVTDISNTLGLAKNTVTGYLNLLTLSKRTIELSVEKRIPFTHLNLIAIAVKSAPSPKIRRDLEQALVNKVADGVIQKASDIAKYGRVIREENQKVIAKIISNPDYTAKEALVDAGIYGDIQVRTIVNHASWLSGFMAKAIELGFNKNLEGAGQKSLEDLEAKIHKFIDTAGYVEQGK